MMNRELRARIRSGVPKREKKISVDDWLYENELAAIAAERAKAYGANGNGSVEEPRYCSCPETLMPDGRRIPMPKFHCCSYSRQRAALVKTAARAARASARNTSEFQRLFTAEMTKAAAPLLLAT